MSMNTTNSLRPRGDFERRSNAVVDGRLALDIAPTSHHGGSVDDVGLQQLGVALAGVAGEVVALGVLGAVGGDRRDDLRCLACGLCPGALLALKFR